MQSRRANSRGFPWFSCLLDGRINICSHRWCKISRADQPSWPERAFPTRRGCCRWAFNHVPPFLVFDVVPNVSNSTKHGVFFLCFSWNHESTSTESTQSFFHEMASHSLMLCDIGELSHYWRPHGYQWEMPRGLSVDVGFFAFQQGSSTM